MRIISAGTLRKYWTNHKETEEPLRAWVGFAKRADWKSPKDIKKQFTKACILSGNRAVFDICGGNYRLVIKVNYEHRIVWIRFLGTHTEYDKINAEEI
ncbi:MAG: type II toxin-antitoxin system HigB family toxin [Spirochaetes bacterium]|nr:MAG: type II toxin-antitoxin system HigB family toxin [Spirochaetota bacterium]